MIVGYVILIKELYNMRNSLSKMLLEFKLINVSNEMFYEMVNNYNSMNNLDTLNKVNSIQRHSVIENCLNRTDEPFFCQEKRCKLSYLRRLFIAFGQRRCFYSVAAFTQRASRCCSVVTTKTSASQISPEEEATRGNRFDGLPAPSQNIF